MRASNEVSVGRSEFVAALNLGRPARKPLAGEETLLYMQGERLVIEASDLTAEIAAAGRWESPVAVSAVVLRRLAGKLPRTDPVVLVFVAGRLHVGATSIAARNAATRIDARPEDGGQLSMPGIGHAMPRDRAEAAARRPLRPRSRQKPAGGLFARRPDST